MWVCGGAVMRADGERQQQQQQKGVSGALVAAGVGCSSSSSSGIPAAARHMRSACMSGCMGDHIWCRGTPTLVLTVLQNNWQQLQATLMQWLLPLLSSLPISPVAYPVSSFVTHSPLRHSSN